MPELPEAETIVRGIRGAVSGRRIEDVEVLHRDVLAATPTSLRRGLADRRIAGVGRRAKNVLLEMDDESAVWINLGMTGRVLPLPRPPRTSPARARYGPVATHPAVVFLLGSGMDLVFDDCRRFGKIEHLNAPASQARSRTFGPEPPDRRIHARRPMEQAQSIACPRTIMAARPAQARGSREYLR